MNRVLHFPSLDSTNAYAKAHARDLADGTVIRADAQTAGRGRFDRVWASEPGGLYFSVVLKPSKTAFLQNLTQLMALCVCRAANQLGANARLKWPNDVLADDKKICGILSEAVLHENRFYALALGVGINVAQPDLRAAGQPAVSLAALGVRADADRLLADVLDRFRAQYEETLEKGFAAFAAEYKALFPYLGKPIWVTNEGRKISGVAQDISPAGTLLLATPDGTREFSIGDMNA